jgi:serine/threonine protein kinase
MEKSCSQFPLAHVSTMSSISMQQSGCSVDTRHVEPVPYNHPDRASQSPLRKDEWKKTFSFTTAKSIGRGASGTVFAINDAWVIKVFGRDAEAQSYLVREKEIFDKLQIPVLSDYIIFCKEQWASGLVLERFECTLRERLKTFVAGDSKSPHPSALMWSLECCRGFAFLHDNDIIHGDIGCQNVMVSASGHAKLCDFAGSKIGQKDALVAYEIRSQHVRYSGQQPTITTEIFAIGSLLFEIWALKPPYAAELNSVVKERFRLGEFPIGSISNLSMKGVIHRCWLGVYHTVSGVCEDLEAVKPILEFSTLPD